MVLSIFGVVLTLTLCGFLYALIKSEMDKREDISDRMSDLFVIANSANEFHSDLIHIKSQINEVNAQIAGINDFVADTIDSKEASLLESLISHVNQHLETKTSDFLKELVKIEVEIGESIGKLERQLIGKKQVVAKKKKTNKNLPH